MQAKYAIIAVWHMAVNHLAFSGLWPGSLVKFGDLGLTLTIHLFCLMKKNQSFDDKLVKMGPWGLTLVVKG